MHSSCDIFIAGGGIGGLTAAVAFGSAGFKVICVDPVPLDQEYDHLDVRTTAILQPAHKFLKTIDVWDRLAPHSSALNTLRIIDIGSGQGNSQTTQDFHSSDISEESFGWNIPNWHLKHVLSSHVDELENVEFWKGLKARDLFSRQNEAHVTLNNDRHVIARLVLACDGRNSPIRYAAGIPVKTWRYGQKALAFAVTHPIPHNNISTEIHRTGGPFTFVPLPGHNNTPRSAVVWMEDGPKANQFFSMNEINFEEAISERSCYIYGPLTLSSRRTIWPIISQYATRITGERLALMAEAAHVVPPIGAQGLNISFSDIRTLWNLAIQQPDSLGSSQMLAAYHRKRFNDIRLRVGGIDLLNRISKSRTKPFRDARATGLSLLHASRPVRQTLMKAMLGTT